jgi:hypothetical protein
MGLRWYHKAGQGVSTVAPNGDKIDVIVRDVLPRTRPCARIEVMVNGKPNKVLRLEKEMD